MFKLQAIILLVLFVFNLEITCFPNSITKSIRNLFRRNKGGKDKISQGSDDDLLKAGIAKFYDESSDVWLKVWGENMHHGYYIDPKDRNHKQRQVDMIDRAIAWAYLNDANDISHMESKISIKNMVDVGCGVGGSSRHISKVFGSSGKGISLSPFQIHKANDLTKFAKLESKLEYLVADAFKMPFEDATFDLTWSMESGEHMPNKEKFMNELVRVTSPSGRIIIVTWCHRELLPGESTLKTKELKLLKKINDAYYLPDWVAPSAYVDLATKLKMEDIRCEDWSKFVTPFWPAVIRSALNPINFLRLIRSGSTTFRGAIAMLYMMRGFKNGLIKFAVITCKKPLTSS